MTNLLAELSPERRAVAEVVLASDTPLTAKQVSEQVESSYSSVRNLLPRLVSDGVLSRPSRGLYGPPVAGRFDDKDGHGLTPIEIRGSDQLPVPGPIPTIWVMTLPNGSQLRFRLKVEIEQELVGPPVEGSLQPDLSTATSL